MCFSIQVDKDLKKLAQKYRAHIARDEFIKLPQMPFKIPESNGRVFPNYFAPVIIHEKGTRVIHPMRYRIRPAKSLEEIPTKFNVFNARFDSLETRATWKNIFGKKHGIISLKKFYEWVPGENGKPKLISFYPQDQEEMIVPCLYDYWTDPENQKSFYSFAIITTEPNPEILEKGHDRSPIFLKKTHIEDWLNSKNKEEAKKILMDQEKAFYLFSYENKDLILL